MPDAPKLNFGQRLTKSTFKAKVNNNLEKVPGGNQLKNNETFKQGLDHFSGRFAKQPNARTEPGKAVGQAAFQEAISQYANLPDLAAQGLVKGITGWGQK